MTGLVPVALAPVVDAPVVDVLEPVAATAVLLAALAAVAALAVPAWCSAWISEDMKLSRSWVWFVAVAVELPLVRPVAIGAAVPLGTMLCSVEVMSCSRLPPVAAVVLPESVLAKLLGLATPFELEDRLDREFWLAICCSQLLSFEMLGVCTVVDS